MAENRRTSCDVNELNIDAEQNNTSAQTGGWTAICSPYLILGIALAILFVGIGLTAASYKSYRETDNQLAVVAPLCLVAGLIATTRLIYKKIKLLKLANQCPMDRNGATDVYQIQVEETTPSMTDTGQQQVRDNIP